MTTPQDDLTRQAERTDADRISGLIGEYVFDHLASELAFTEHFGTDKFKSVTGEEYRDLGYDPDDPYGEIVIKRERDGQLFELEIDVTAHPLRQKAEAHQ